MRFLKKHKKEEVDFDTDDKDDEDAEEIEDEEIEEETQDRKNPAPPIKENAAKQKKEISPIEAIDMMQGELERMSIWINYLRQSLI